MPPNIVICWRIHFVCDSNYIGQSPGTEETEERL